MARKPSEKDPSKYPKYRQYAFRTTENNLIRIQGELDALYKKFNKGRDPNEPKGKKAVKVSDIALEALEIGISALRKRPKWDFKGD